MRAEARAAAGGRMKDQRLRPREDEDVVQDPAVSVGEECLAALAGLKGIELVGGEAVEEFGPLAAGDLDLGHGGRAEETGRPAKGPVFGLPIAEIEGNRPPGGVTECGASRARISGIEAAVSMD